MVITTINLKEQHKRWVKENDINLSRLIQRIIDKRMNKVDKKFVKKIKRSLEDIKQGRIKEVEITKEKKQ